MRLWAPRGHNCIHSDSTLGLWMHRCTVAEQCDLIATATSTFVRYTYVGREGRDCQRVGPSEIGTCRRDVPLS